MHGLDARRCLQVHVHVATRWFIGFGGLGGMECRQSGIGMRERVICFFFFLEGGEGLSAGILFLDSDSSGNGQGK